MFYLVGSKIVKKFKKNNDFNARSLSFAIDYATYFQIHKLSPKTKKEIVSEINKNKFDSYEDLFKNELFLKSIGSFKQIINAFKELIVYSHKISEIKYWYEKKYKEVSKDDLYNYINAHKELEKLVSNELGMDFSGFSKNVNKYLFTPKVQ